MRKIFDIYINDKPFPVFDIENKHHELGKWNSSPTTWWLLLEKDIVEPKLIIEMEEESKLIPYIDKGIHRICWEINYKQSNHINYKWDETQIRNSGVCILKANGREVYKFNSPDLMFAMTKVQTLVNKIITHPYNFLEPEKDEGRKIFFCGLPAFVYKGYEVGEIKIQPDYSNINKKVWWEKYDFYNSYDEENYDEENDDELNINDSEEVNEEMINWGDALEDGKIWWFRK